LEYEAKRHPIPQVRWLGLGQRKKENIMSTTQTNGTSSATKKAPAKAAPAKKAAEAKAEKKDGGKLFIYGAQGRAGITNRRTFPHQVTVAADVKDSEHTSKRWQTTRKVRFAVAIAVIIAGMLVVMRAIDASEDGLHDLNETGQQ
jgi:hypothetical protein